MDYIYGYTDDNEEIRGTCLCGFELKNLLETNIKRDFETKCPSCDRPIKIKVLDLIVDLRGLKVIKNKLEKRCVSLIIDTAVYNILDNYIETFPSDIKVSIREKSFNNFELTFNDTQLFFVQIKTLDIIREFNKFKTNFTITKESDPTFNLNIQDAIYY
ncbi:MAG: hypothetical protein ACRCTZ_18405 [Sarcina sp.]